MHTAGSLPVAIILTQVRVNTVPPLQPHYLIILELISNLREICSGLLIIYSDISYKTFCYTVVTQQCGAVVYIPASIY